MASVYEYFRNATTNLNSNFAHGFGAESMHDRFKNVTAHLSKLDYKALRQALMILRVPSRYLPRDTSDEALSSSFGSTLSETDEHTRACVTAISRNDLPYNTVCMAQDYLKIAMSSEIPKGDSVTCEVFIRLCKRAYGDDHNAFHSATTCRSWIEGIPVGIRSQVYSAFQRERRCEPCH